jgi:hypothetical protein
VRRLLHLPGVVALTAAAFCCSLAGTTGVGTLLDAGPGLPAGGLAVAALPVGCVVFVAVLETRRAVRDGPLDLSATDAATLCAVAAAAPVTRLLAVEAGLGAVVASALVGLVAGVLFEEYAAPVYCGSFVGMVAPAVLADLAVVTAAGVVAGAVFVAADRVFGGFGGKLGTTAFAGCGLVALATGATPGPPGPVPTPTAAVGLVLLTGAAAAATFAVSVRLDHGPVVASAVVGLAAGLLASAFGHGVRPAAAAFCGSFVGMADPARLPDEATTFAAGAVAGLLFVGATPALVGFGGKLGTLAFVGCLVVHALAAVGDVVPVGGTVTSE